MSLDIFPPPLPQKSTDTLLIDEQEVSSTAIRELLTAATTSDTPLESCNLDIEIGEKVDKLESEHSNVVIKSSELDEAVQSHHSIDKQHKIKWWQKKWRFKWPFMCCGGARYD